MVEGLFEMIRSADEGKVQELLAMIRGNASMGSIADKIEASMKSPAGSQKRKRSVSSSGMSKDGMSTGERSGDDDQTERRDVPPPTDSVDPTTPTSRSTSRPTLRPVTSPNDLAGVSGLTLATHDDSHHIIDLAQVRAFVSGLVWGVLFSHRFHWRISEALLICLVP